MMNDNLEFRGKALVEAKPGPYVRSTAALSQPTSSPAGSRLSWEAEWREVLHRICSGILAKTESGLTVDQAIKAPSFYYRRRHFRSAPSIRLKTSKSTLRRYYYFWLRNGRCPESFVLKYHRLRPPADPDQVRKFVHACTVTFSMQAAFDMISHPGLTWRTFSESLPARLRSEIRRLQAERRAIFRERDGLERRYRSGALKLLQKAQRAAQRITALAEVEC